MRPLVTVLMLGAAAFVMLSLVTRGGERRTAVDPKQVRAGRIKFGLGGALLGLAAVLFLLDVKQIAVTAAYVLGAGLLVNGYLQDRNARRGRRFGPGSR